MQQFIVRERYVWVECDLPGYEGFRAEVRQNLTQGERTILRERLADLEEQLAGLQETHLERAAEIDRRRGEADDPLLAVRAQAETRDLMASYGAAVEERLRSQHALLAPHVRAWNLFVPGADGVPEPTPTPEPVPVPAPASAGAAVFDELDRPLVAWLIGEVLMAYRGGKGLSAGSTRSGAPPAPGHEPTPAGPQVIDTPATPASPPWSSGPSA